MFAAGSRISYGTVEEEVMIQKQWIFVHETSTSVLVVHHSGGVSALTLGFRIMHVTILAGFLFWLPGAYVPCWCIYPTLQHSRSVSV